MKAYLKPPEPVPPPPEIVVLEMTREEARTLLEIAASPMIVSRALGGHEGFQLMVRQLLDNVYQVLAGAAL